MKVRVAATRNPVGRPPKSGSLRDPGRTLRVDEATIRFSDKVDAILNFYPELDMLPPSAIVAVADLLDDLPGDQRPGWFARLRAANGRGLSAIVLDLRRASGAATGTRENTVNGVTRSEAQRVRRTVKPRLSHELWDLTRHVEHLERQQGQQAQLVQVDPPDVVVADTAAIAATLFGLAVQHRPGLKPPPSPNRLSPEEEAETSLRWLLSHIVSALYAIRDLAQVSPRVVRQTLTAPDIRKAAAMASAGAEYLDRLARELNR